MQNYITSLHCSSLPNNLIPFLSLLWKLVENISFVSCLHFHSPSHITHLSISPLKATPCMSRQSTHKQQQLKQAGEHIPANKRLCQTVSPHFHTDISFFCNNNVLVVIQVACSADRSWKQYLHNFIFYFLIKRSYKPLHPFWGLQIYNIKCINKNLWWNHWIH